MVDKLYTIPAKHRDAVPGMHHTHTLLQPVPAAINHELSPIYTNTADEERMSVAMLIAATFDGDGE